MKHTIAMALSCAAALGCGSSTNNNSDGGVGDGSPGLDQDGGNGSDGAVDDGCPAYQRECAGACVVTAVDPLNCGGCGVECTGNTACSGGSCSATCLGGLDICSNQCVDTQSNSDHCGGCNAPCGSGLGCVDGACEATITVGPEPAECAAGLPPQVSDGTETTCAGDLAETTFRWALCSCTDVTASNPMVTDGYSSSSGSYQPGGLGGGIGLNGSFAASSEIDVFGDLWASASGGLASTNPTAVMQQLHVGGPVNAAGSFQVGEDAYVAGDLVASDIFVIGGSLHIPSTASISGNVTYQSRIDENVQVQQPCDCNAGQLIDVAGIVAWGASNNDNLAIGLDPNVLVSPADSTRLDLPCGSYYFSSIDVSSPTVIWVHGRTTLFIGGDVTSTSSLQINLDPDAELNVFIGGTITATNPLSIGSVLYPALTRVYVAGSSEITLSNPTDIGGFLYAAYGLLNVQNPLTVFGGIYAGDYNADNPVDIHYDREVLNVGDDCPDDPGGDGCNSCLDCNGQACNGGTCGACTSDSDCCAPLRCHEGMCVSGAIID